MGKKKQIDQLKNRLLKQWQSAGAEVPSLATMIGLNCKAVANKMAVSTSGSIDKYGHKTGNDL